MIPGDMVRLAKEPWSVHAGEYVIVTKVDDNGNGFDFVIPEQRGHAPMRLADLFISHFDLSQLTLVERKP